MNSKESIQLSKSVSKSAIKTRDEDITQILNVFFYNNFHFYTSLAKSLK